MSVIWGMPYLFIKVADGGVSVPVLVFTRLAVAAALLLPLAIRRRQFAGLWRHWRWLVLVAVCYATGPIIVNRKLSELPGLGVNAFCLSFAAIVYAPVAALTWPAAVPSAQVLASLAALGVICTALAFILFFKLIAEAGPA